MFKTQFDKKDRFISRNSGQVHPLFENTEPLTIREMLRRSINGIPLSIPKPKENLPLNGNFFSDKFDIIDTAIRNDMRLSEEQKELRLKEREQQRQQYEEFKQWKEEQQRLANVNLNDKLTAQ